MTVTFTKLLVMRMVANVRSLSWRSISILRSFALCSTSKSAMSVGERLKKEISDALANPESSSRKTTKKNEMTTPRVGVWSVISEKASVNDDMSKSFVILNLEWQSFIVVCNVVYWRCVLLFCSLLWGDRLSGRWLRSIL